MRVAAFIAPVVAIAALAQPAVARRAPRPRPPVTVSVTMSDRAFVPSTVRMPAGRRVALRLTNVDRTEHGFSATAFFAAASLDASAVGMIENGAVSVRSGETRVVRLIPRAGVYELSSKKVLDQVSDMRGRIVVR